MSNKFFEDYQEPDTESDAGVDYQTEYAERSEEQDAKKNKLKESEGQYEKYHKEWQSFLQLKKQVNKDFKRFQTTNFKDKADADDAESSANQGVPEEQDPGVEADAQALEDQNGQEVTDSKEQLVPAAASNKVGVENPA